MNKDKNLYEILEVDPMSTRKVIKQAYLRLAKMHHPDKGGDEETFKGIQNAYDVLSDADRRLKYDKTGESGKEKVTSPEAALAEIFAMCIQKSSHFNANIITSVTRNMESSQSRIEDELLKVKKRQADLVAVAERVKVKDGGMNMFSYALDQARWAMSERITMLEKNLSETTEIVKLLSDYSDSFDNASAVDSNISRFQFIELMTETMAKEDNK